MKLERSQVADLVRKAQAGDPEALERLLETAYKNVLYQCRKIMRHPEDAEDMAQETMIRICEKLNTLQEPERFLSWANTIASNRCINERKRNPKDLQFLENEDGGTVLDNLEDTDWKSVPDAVIDNAETSRMVDRLVDALPDEQRATVSMYYNAEMSVADIAKLMGVSENTVKSRLHYGRRAVEKGVRRYEKEEGIKLYGLSPLPFLLYFLRSAAESATSDAAAAAAATAALSAGAATGTVAAEAAAGTAAAETAGAAAGAAATEAAGAAAGTAAAGAASAGAAGGLLGTVGVKVAAIVVAGALAVGGGAALWNGRETTPPAEETVQAEPPAAGPEETEAPAEEPPAPEPEPESEPADPNAPVEEASHTVRRTTVAEEDGHLGGIYLETPLFDEVNEGYRQINAYFDRFHQAFNAQDDPKVAAMLPLYESGEFMAEYSRTGGVVYQDGYYVSVLFEETVWPLGTFAEDARLAYTFDVRTGQLLELSDLSGLDDAATAEWVADAIRASEFSNVLTADNYPGAGDGFVLADSAVDPEDMEWNMAYATIHAGSPYTAGTPLYVWLTVETADLVEIPLPAALTPDGGAAEPASGEATGEAALPAYTARRTEVDAGSAASRITVETPVFDSDSPGYQAINAYFEEDVDNFLDSMDLAVLQRVFAFSGATEQDPNVFEVTFEVTEQTAERVTVRMVMTYHTPDEDSTDEEIVTFDTATGQRIG